MRARPPCGSRRPSVDAVRSLGGRAEDDARVEVDLATDEAARHAGLGAGGDDEVEAARAARSGSSRARCRARCARARGQLVESCRAPGRRGRCRRRSRGLSSTKPSTRSPAVSRSSRIRLRPVRPAPTITRASAGAVAHRLRADDDRALGEPRRADGDHADQRVDDEERAREVAHVLRQHHEGERDDLGDDDRAARSPTASRAPA